MKQRLRVRLNVSLLITNRSREEGRAVTEEEVAEWLKDAGFTREDDTHWTVLEPDLGHLDPSEVLDVKTIENG